MVSAMLADEANKLTSGSLKSSLLGEVLHVFLHAPQGSIKLPPSHLVLNA